MGRKLGMTQLFMDNGKAEAVTVVEAGPCVVIQVKTEAKEGYNAAQLGFGKAKRLKAPQRGHLKELGEFKYLREFRLDDTGDVKVGEYPSSSVIALASFSSRTGSSSTSSRPSKIVFPAFDTWS